MRTGGGGREVEGSRGRNRDNGSELWAQDTGFRGKGSALKERGRGRAYGSPMLFREGWIAEPRASKGLPTAHTMDE